MHEEKNPIQSAQRIFNILELLAQEGELGLIEISERMKLNKTTVHRMLSSLIYMGYARQIDESSKYVLTYKIVNLSGKLLDKINVLPIARPFLEELSSKSGETVHLVQREGNHILYIDKMEAKIGSIRMVSYIGMRHPMYCSGVGKAILSTLNKQEIQQVFENSHLVAMTPKTIIDPKELESVIEQAKINGYALDDEENELGVRCIAAALSDYSGKTSYAFSISGPVNRMTYERIEELKELVIEVKAKLSIALGGRENIEGSKE